MQLYLDDMMPQKDENVLFVTLGAGMSVRPQPDICMSTIPPFANLSGFKQHGITDCLSREALDVLVRHHDPVPQNVRQLPQALQEEQGCIHQPASKTLLTQCTTDVLLVTDL